MMLPSAILVIIIICLSQLIHGWQQWDFTSYPSSDWHKLWGPLTPLGERRGHTMVLYNASKVILFGGRGKDKHFPHVPRRFNLIEDEGGVVEFATHDNHPLSSDFSPESPQCQPIKTCLSLLFDRQEDISGAETDENDEVCSYSWEHLLENNASVTEQAKIEEKCGFVPAAVHFNDVWMYDTDCKRYADLACSNDGWKILDPGKTFGGCDNNSGELVCQTPSERYGHGAAMLNETTMAVYGGFSNECHDYCDDFWLFDFISLQWTKVESQITPGNRWQFSMVSDGTSIYLFGGNRLWHGFSGDNSADNRWDNTDELPEGGYMNDKWVYSTNDGWRNVEGKTTCVDAPGLTWESRNDKHCEVYWPSARSGHAAVYDARRHGMWLHGGFSTYYPYPSSKSAGSAVGTRELGREHTALHPSWEFWLDDLWFYDIKSGYWEKKIIFGRKPHRRTDHVLIVSGDVLVLHGGFGDNVHFEDSWQYIIEENRWLEKTDFVHAQYPETCTDDISTIKDDSTCIELEFSNDLKRSNESTLALDYQEILPFSEQKGYTPDPDYPLYFGIVNDAEEFVKELRQKYLLQEVYDEKEQRIWIESSVPDGTPIAPKAATAPRQYARQKIVKYNETTNLEVWEWCVSVRGEPTRDREDDGKLGRSNTSIFIPQPRILSPGWDGCRDLKWTYPPAQADHASVYVDKYDMLVTHGGISYNPSDNETSNPLNKAHVLSDLWVLNMHNCAHNCSDHGVCTNGFCECDPGYYGVDCSNVTCPGSACEYDNDYSQHCTHCCHDVVDDRKIPCSLVDDELMLFAGTSEGICDGFGTCQCAPPYIGEDCSILDCKYNCSFNGYCMVEWPQARCMCKDGYTGEYCQHLECLNNCSYPNGICDQDTGICACNTLYSPYIKTKSWSTWQGQDCSYLPAFSGASHRLGISFATLLGLLFALLLWWSYNYPLSLY